MDKRTILIYIIVILVLLILGFLFSSNLLNDMLDKEEVYNKAIEISDNTEEFKYAMKTNVGNALVEGDLVALTPVSCEGIEGEYYLIKKVKERYTPHTRTVVKTDLNGNTTTEIETYWTWDYVSSETKKTEKVEFCGVEFAPDKIGSIKLKHITTRVFGDIRYVYSGYPTKTRGTIFTQLKDSTISSNSIFFEEKGPKEVLETIQKSSKVQLGIFWVAWLAFIAFMLYLISSSTF